MRVEVRPIYHLGRELPKKVRQAQAPVCGHLSIQENRLTSAGRIVMFATVRDNINGIQADLLPELADARLLWMLDTNMRITGVEKFDNALYAQTWDVKVISC